MKKTKSHCQARRRKRTIKNNKEAKAHLRVAKGRKNQSQVTRKIKIRKLVRSSQMKRSRKRKLLK